MWQNIGAIEAAVTTTIMIRDLTWQKKMKIMGVGLKSQTDFLTEPISNKCYWFGVNITTTSRTATLLWIHTVTEHFGASCRHSLRS